jgi:hypothetical protein
MTNTMVLMWSLDVGLRNEASRTRGLLDRSRMLIDELIMNKDMRAMLIGRSRLRFMNKLCRQYLGSDRVRPFITLQDAAMRNKTSVVQTKNANPSSHRIHPSIGRLFVIFLYILRILIKYVSPGLSM